MSNKNYYETFIELELKNLNEVKHGIEQKEFLIEELKHDYIDLKSICYDKIIDKNVNKEKNNMFITLTDKIIEIEDSIKKDKKEIKLLKNYLDKLDDKSIRNIIVYKYFERKTWKEIKKITGFSETALKYKRDKGLTKLAFMYFGYEVLQEI